MPEEVFIEPGDVMVLELGPVNYEIFNNRSSTQRASTLEAAKDIARTISEEYRRDDGSRPKVLFRTTLAATDEEAAAVTELDV